MEHLEFWLIQHCPLVVKSRAVGNDKLQESVKGYVDYQRDSGAAASDAGWKDGLEATSEK